MPIFNPTEGSSIKYQTVNAEIPAPIISSLIANPKTSFNINPAIVIPESAAIIGGVAHIEGSGVFTTGLVALNLTLSVEMQGIIVASATVTPALNLINMGWEIDIIATILSSGQVEVQGHAAFSSSLTVSNLVKIRNTVSYSMSTSGGVPVTISAQWGILAAGGSITLRQSFIQVT